MDYQPGINAGYTDDRVRYLDIDQLRKDAAVVLAADHLPSTLVGITPYYLTDEGRQMLIDADYLVDHG